tara:strand:+ start:269 stop:526 length:258 start_codon:yes stop_codon:yes gene_type:complete
MLEKQRVHLEGLIDELVDASLFASDCDGTDFAGSAIEAKEKAGDRVKEYLDFIQSYTGTHQKDLGHWVNELGHWVLVDTSTEEEK